MAKTQGHVQVLEGFQHPPEVRFEFPDPTPVEIPAEFQRPESIQEIIARQVHGELSRLARDQGMESFEEAMDFEMEDDDISVQDTPHTMLADEEVASEFADRLRTGASERSEAGQDARGDAGSKGQRHNAGDGQPGDSAGSAPRAADGNGGAREPGSGSRKDGGAGGDRTDG